MPSSWIDVNTISIDHLLLLERVQIKWLFEFIKREDLCIILNNNKTLKWFFENKCPEVKKEIDSICKESFDEKREVNSVYKKVLNSIADWMVYATDPKIYDNMPFLNWDSNEILNLTDFNKKVIIDVGSGTGKLAFTVKTESNVVYCVEPVENLRNYIYQKSNKIGINGLYTVDGLITSIPFQNEFADIVMGGHVFGDQKNEEYEELMRVLKINGICILCPGNNDEDNDTHRFLLEKEFSWSRFEEPSDGIKRKYWKKKSA